MSRVKMGWGKRCISIDEPVSIPGQMHMRISEGIMDPLYATALCIDGGEGQDVVIMCSMDTIVLRGGIQKQIREAVAARNPQIPVENIILNATHTHTGSILTDTPETTPDGKPIYPASKYREFCAAQCADAICEAWDTRKEGGIAYGYGYAVVAHSRRVVYFDDTSLRQGSSPVAPNGHARMYGNTDDEQFSHYEAGADHFLNAMFTFDAENNLTGMIVNIPCPSQMTEHHIQQSADFWHDIRKAVAEQYGEHIYVLSQCAAAGDLSPRILHYKQAQERRMALKYGKPYGEEDPYKLNKPMTERWDVAERVITAINEVYGWAKKEIFTDIPVQHTVRTLQLPRRRITDEEKQWCEETLVKMASELDELKNGTPEEVRKAVSTYNAVYARNQRAIAKWKLLKEEPCLPMECHVLRIGDIAFATNRFELYMDFMHRIQARSPFIQTFIVQLAGDEDGSYLPTQRGVEGKGYSASIFCNYVGPEGGQTLVDETVAILKEMHASNT